MDSRPNLNDDPVQYVLHALWADLTRKGAQDAIYCIREALAQKQYAEALAYAIAIEIDRAKRDDVTRRLIGLEKDTFALLHRDDTREIPVKDTALPPPVVITTSDIDAALKEPTFKQPPRLPNPPKIR